MRSVASSGTCSGSRVTGAQRHVMFVNIFPLWLVSHRCCLGVNVGAVTSARSDEPGRWRIFGEREVYASPELWLGQVDVELPGGERVWEHLVRLHRAAFVAVLDEQNRVLLIRRYRIVAGTWGWELPGGLIDDGEEPSAAALRELEDSTECRVGRTEHLVTFRPLPETVDCEHIVFVGHEPVRAAEATGSVDVDRTEWVPLASVPGLVGTGQIWHGGTMVGLLRLLTMDGQAADH